MKYCQPYSQTYVYMYICIVGYLNSLHWKVGSTGLRQNSLPPPKNLLSTVDPRIHTWETHSWHSIDGSYEGEPAKLLLIGGGPMEWGREVAVLRGRTSKHE